jgi:site-specific DNA recombinase
MVPKIRFFIYIRKSTDDRKGKRQVLSLEGQLRNLREIVKRDSLVVVGMIEESRTAKEPGRPLFNKMLDRIERGEANGILIWDLDRLYRNPVDEGRTRWMLQRGIVASIQTPTRSFFPPDAGLLMAVEGGRGIDFIIHHKRDVTRGIEDKLLRGEWPGNKPIGYIYDHTLRNIVPDPKRAKIIKAIFEEVSVGMRGLRWTAERLAEMGVRTKKRRLLSNFRVYKLLTNRLYTGVMVWNGQVFEGKYQPIVSQELFNKVQKALKVRSKPRKTRNGHNFPFCGLFHCTCGSMMTAQWARGRHGGLYRYYRCTRKAGGCSEPYLQEKFVAEQCLDILRPLAISTEQATLLRDLMDAEVAKEGDAVESAVEQVTERLVGVQTKLNKLTRAYLKDLIDNESYETAASDLVIEKTGLKQEKQRLQRTGSSYWNEPSLEVINTLELAGKAQASKSPQEISPLVHKVGTNPQISRKTVSFSFGEPYAVISSYLGNLDISPATTSSLCDEKNPKGYQLPAWCGVRGSNPRPCPCKGPALPLS